MGEIRSTLDIIMAKTEHLSLSDDEKVEQALAEGLQKIRGLVQQFIDGAVRIDELREQLATLEQKSGAFPDAMLLDALAERLALEEAGNAVSDLLGSFFSADSMLAVHTKYQEQVRRAAATRQAAIIRELQEGCHISGSSVEPNLAADAAWRKERQDIFAAFAHDLTRAKAAVTRLR